jgi:L-fuconolactonase
MSIIDSHHHVWWTGRHSYHWPPKAADRLNREFTPDDLQVELKACGIDGTVLVQVLRLEETREFLDIQRNVDFVRGVVGWVPLADPDAVTKAIDELAGRGKLVGIRHLINNEPDPKWLLQPKVIESLGLLSAVRLVFDVIPITAAQLESVLEIARRLPDLSIVINHLGEPPVPEKGWEPWASQMARAAECPNVTVKLSAGLALVVKWTWSTDEIRRYADHVLERFGASRVMAASNWPVVLLGGSFGEVWRGIVDLTAGLSESERADVLGGTAERVYRLAPKEPA